MNRADTLKQIADYFTGLGTLFEVLAAESASGPVRPAGPEAATPATAPASTDTVLGECPVHFLPWVVKEGGVSAKTGKRYGAFWKCDEKNADGTWCSKKPTLEWVRTHDPERAA